MLNAEPSFGSPVARRRIGAFALSLTSYDSPSPRRAVISGTFVNLDPSSAHGKANRRIFAEVTN